MSNQESDEETQNSSSTGANRQALTHISLSNVLWILITVVSIASFVFSYDTRITVLENQTSDIPAIEQRVNTLRDKVKTLQSQLKATQSQLEDLQESSDNNIAEISNMSTQIREMEYRIKTLKQQISRLEQLMQQKSHQ